MTTDVLRGGPGADAFQSSRGPDRIVAGGGDDYVGTTLRCPVVDAGAGTDSLVLKSLDLVAGQETVRLDARSGQVTPAADQPACGEIAGFESYRFDGRARVTFHGTEGPDELHADGGALTAYVLGGDDDVTGSPHDDVVDAGDGDDTVAGGFGRDACLDAEHTTGCDGDQLPLPPPSCDGRTATLLATPGEVLTGTPGDDVMGGSEASDTIEGLGGDDVICGGEGADVIDGGDGNDRIFAGLDVLESIDIGTFRMRGEKVRPGRGDDYVDLGFDERELDQEQGGGIDTLDYSASTTGIGTDLADRITGGPQREQVVGRAGNDVIDGRAGGDWLSGEGGFCCDPPRDADTLLGGPGDDELDSAAGHDSFDGGDGDDVIHTDSPLGASMLGGPGDDDLDVRVVGARSAYDVDGGPGRDRVGFGGVAKALLGERVVVDVRAGVLRSRALDLSVRFGGFESYQLYGSGHLGWSFVGSPAAERLGVYTGGSLVARMLGGDDDVVSGSPGPDVVTGGAGRDRANLYDGRDRCVSVEVAISCRTPAGAPVSP